VKVIAVVASGGSAVRPTLDGAPECCERRERLSARADRLEVAAPFGALDRDFESAPTVVREEGCGLGNGVERRPGLGHHPGFAPLGRIVGERPERALH
jgi:hypothetical protein